MFGGPGRWCRHGSVYVFGKSVWYFCVAVVMIFFFFFSFSFSVLVVGCLD